MTRIFIIYDNVRPEEPPEPDCNGNTVPDGCETIDAGDFDGDGDVDLTDFAALANCLAGPNTMPAPAEPTCGHLCLDAFHFDDDLDIELNDFAAFQTTFTEVP